MSTMTAETILNLIEQLPPPERTRLDEMLAQQTAAAVQVKPPRDKRVPAKPMRDRTRERQWVQAHKHEYPGHWVALDGDHLVAASLVQKEVVDAVHQPSGIHSRFNRAMGAWYKNRYCRK